MRYTFLTYLLAFCTLSCTQHEIVADEGEIREAIKSYVAAFNKKDLASVEKLWSETAIYVDHQTGERTESRTKIIEDIKNVFDNSSVLILTGTIEDVRMVKDDVAIVQGEVTLSAGSDPVVNNYSAVLLKQNGVWTIDMMEERAVSMPATAADALRELEWLVGEWKDDSGDSLVRTSVRWAIGGSFLVRSFEATSEDGRPLQSSQIIGWDPRSQQFRSWTFDADGSFGDGDWIKSDNQWLIKSTQTLADGRAASGTYVMTMQDKDSFTVQLIGREIEGEPQPASEVVTIKRAVDENQTGTDGSATNTTPSK